MALPTFITKTWENDEDSLSTPTSAAAFEDMEQRLSDYTVLSHISSVGLPLTFKAGDWLWPPIATIGNSFHQTGLLFVHPILVPQLMNFDRIGCRVNGAGPSGSSVRLGIYNDNGAGRPGTLRIDAGTVAINATGNKEKTITEQLTPGICWVAFQAEYVSGSPFFATITSNIMFFPTSNQGSQVRSGFNVANTGSLPATFPLGNEVGVENSPLVTLRVS